MSSRVKSILEHMLDDARDIMTFVQEQLNFFSHPEIF